MLHRNRPGPGSAIGTHINHSGLLSKHSMKLCKAILKLSYKFLLRRVNWEESI
jgi:hypothetical protein